MEYTEVRLRTDELPEIQYLPESQLVELKEEDLHKLMEVRDNGEFAEHAIWLDSMYDWVIGRDSHGLLVLIPMRK